MVNSIVILMSVQMALAPARVMAGDVHAKITPKYIRTIVKR